MGGLAKICKLYGGINFVDKNGNKTEYIYDYVRDEPRLKSEMTKDEWMASEKTKWSVVGEHLKKEKQKTQGDLSF